MEVGRFEVDYVKSHLRFAKTHVQAAVKSHVP
jgi:hypothetical protein